MRTGKPLPIDDLLPAITRAVSENPITLLEAEPGAGKTTRVPQALMQAGFETIYVLEPRRLAARMAARRVAEEVGEPLGKTVGFQVRFEEVGGPGTRLWFVTEGVLTRKLLSGRSLPPRSAVVLDEFHERHLETDLALALVRRLQQGSGAPRILIMSATLGAQALSGQLGNAPVVRAAGRVFPVEIRYTRYSAAPLEQQIAQVLPDILASASGHVLIFLPGAAEIRKTIQACEPAARSAGAMLLPLHGELTPEEQDRAVAPAAARKIICSTNVAESSITIEGVDAVIDSGLARIASHSPWSGLSRLQLGKVSRASATQRAGRAGRTGPGLAVRLYAESDFVRRPEQAAPEITRADLSQLVLQLAASNLRVADLNWIDPPPAEALAQASELLLRLDAIQEDGGATTQGRVMATLPVHPRLAAFLVHASSAGAAQEACEIAARLSERSRNGYPGSLEALLEAEFSYPARRLSQQLASTLKGRRAGASDPDALDKAMLRAYPDRVARVRGETLLLSSATTARLDRTGFVHGEYLVAIEVDDRSDQATPLVRMVTPIKPDWLLDFFPERVAAFETMEWNREAERVEQVNTLRYDQLVLDESRGAPTDDRAAAELLAEKAIEAGVDRFAEAEELQRFLVRVRFASRYLPEAAIPADFVTSGVRQLATGLKSFAQLRAAAQNGGLLNTLQALLPMRLVNEVAPMHVALPNGRRAKIEYYEEQAPSVASRLQDFFGMTETPKVARGAVPLVVHLLAPNHRPVQMTTDLVSFWKNLYPQVRRELSRRYPRHAWPEVPA